MDPVRRTPLVVALALVPLLGIGLAVASHLFDPVRPPARSGWEPRPEAELRSQLFQLRAAAQQVLVDPVGGRRAVLLAAERATRAMRDMRLHPREQRSLELVRKFQECVRSWDPDGEDRRAVRAHRDRCLVLLDQAVTAAHLGIKTDPYPTGEER